jgi:hypothetical protein
MKFVHKRLQGICSHATNNARRLVKELDVKFLHPNVDWLALFLVQRLCEVGIEPEGRADIIDIPTCFNEWLSRVDGLLLSQSLLLHSYSVRDLAQHLKQRKDVLKQFQRTLLSHIHTNFFRQSRAACTSARSFPVVCPQCLDASLAAATACREMGGKKYRHKGITSGCLLHQRTGHGYSQTHLVYVFGRSCSRPSIHLRFVSAGDLIHIREKQGVRLLHLHKRRMAALPFHPRD